MTNKLQMTCIERIKHYVHIKPEAAVHTDHPLPPAWPTGGAIAFDNVTLTYREGHTPALRDVSFSIRNKEKVHFILYEY